MLGFVFSFPQEKASISVAGLNRLNSHKPHKLWHGINSPFHQELQITIPLYKPELLRDPPVALSTGPCILVAFNKDLLMDRLIWVSHIRCSLSFLDFFFKGISTKI